MATYGGKYALWAPMTSDTNEGSLPVYGTAMSVGAQNKTTESLSTGGSQLYGDDAEKLNIEEVTSGTLDVQVVSMEDAVEAAINGVTVDDDGGMSYGSDDQIPYGGYGTTNRWLAEDGSVKYRVLFWPKVKAVVQGEEVQTKESNPALAYDKLKFNFTQSLSKTYRVKKSFDSEAEAKAYLDGLLAGTAAAPGLTAAVTA